MLGRSFSRSWPSRVDGNPSGDVSGGFPAVPIQVGHLFEVDVLNYRLVLPIRRLGRRVIAQ